MSARRFCPSDPPFGWYCIADHPAKDWRHCGFRPCWWNLHAWFGRPQI